MAYIHSDEVRENDEEDTENKPSIIAFFILLCVKTSGSLLGYI